MVLDSMPNAFVALFHPNSPPKYVCRDLSQLRGVVLPVLQSWARDGLWLVRLQLVLATVVVEVTA